MTKAQMRRAARWMATYCAEYPYLGMFMAARRCGMGKWALYGWWFDACDGCDGETGLEVAQAAGRVAASMLMSEAER